MLTYTGTAQSLTTMQVASLQLLQPSEAATRTISASGRIKKK